MEFREDLDIDSRGVLDSMLADGTWFEATERIEAVRVVYLNQRPDEDEDANSADFVLAVQQPGGAYTLGWGADETEGGWVMSPLGTVDLTLPRASDWDADSLSAYQSEAGWDVPAGDGLSGTNPDRGDMPMLAYLAAQTTQRLMGDGGPADLDPEQMTQFSRMAGAGGMSPEQAMALMAEGKKNIEDGRLPSPDQVRTIVQGLETASGMLNQDWGEDTILEAMAGVLGIGTDEMRELYEG
jgi:hypothetical protein